MLQKLKIWYDPEKKHYRAFMPSGDELPCLFSIQVSDSVDEIMTSTITAHVDVVNTKPEMNAKN